MRTAGGSRFVGNTAALAVSTVLATVLTVVQMRILAASLPLAVFGLFASLRGLSLLVSLLAANGFPQVLVRFLPELAARGDRRLAARLSAAALVATAAASAVMLAAVVLGRSSLLRDVPEAEMGAPLVAGFALTTVAVSLKLVLYGGFNGLRRFGTQTVLETGALALQVGWMYVQRDSLDLTRLFAILATTSAATALVALPWYAARLRGEVAAGAVAPGEASFARYWTGALGLSVVATAFTDVDRWVLSHVLALESLSLFHVASRIVRLANRFIAIPVLTFQPEVTRVAADGRHDVVRASTSAFFKANVMAAALASTAIFVFADHLIALASSAAFRGARATLLLLAASIPLSAMTAPLTGVMKALDGVKAAFYCDLAWAGVYIGLMLALTPRVGLEGAGVAQLSAAAVQLVLAARLARVRPGIREGLDALARSMLAALVALLPAMIAVRAAAPLVVQAGLGLAAPWFFVRAARRARVLTADDRERLRAVLARRGAGPALSWFIP
jgi:O-antigen/teichoic acid export membrane protein